ncbi:N-acetylmuramoyl-L-alanine amidase [Opitutus sp. GAS368]|uniref:N-acetylmuramoyl-L-alanine amidase n=1 Tax=Opitutus sp. GAS368 TaxID=1882749 RepID=UPI00087AC412|nr:N-acetylmuramoyl-L-alanine amidase [Opitutus sp. GAS368]SDS31799.1 N-acetylmuramoyl-L-alanine amidase [Opitutus sp. GAS368]
MNRRYRSISQAALILSLLALTGCALFNRPGRPLTRKGDEIVVAGQLFHTGTKVVTWMDPGGYDAYRVERRFAPFAESDWDKTIAALPKFGSPNRYSLRQKSLTPEEIELHRGGGWDLPALQRVVDQFVLHYDVAGISRYCFNTLQDHRDLSVHFMLDLDGTIYQTLDLKERARHATISNDRSIGIEIANIGAYPAKERQPLDDWYPRDAKGQPYIKVPEKLGDPMFRTPGFTGHPARPDPVHGVIQGEALEQYDFTPQQYAALIRLTATLCKVFPNITCDYPRDAKGRLIPQKLADDDLAKYHGVLGHYHIQTNKTDPGPALQWDKVINGARRLLRLPTLPEGAPGAP